ncbi:MAG: hypothetical protein C4B55_01850 [Candidatus Methanophagaceae archaeon]|nr:MAG: hypothetical protein C4B55_01850 [Methanophagales archaeon]
MKNFYRAAEKIEKRRKQRRGRRERGMEKISAQKLKHKKIMDSEGSEMGVLQNIVADAGTGILTELVVKPTAKLETSGFRKEGDCIFIPFEAVNSIRDVIVVDRETIENWAVERERERVRGRVRRRA